MGYVIYHWDLSWGYFYHLGYGLYIIVSYHGGTIYGLYIIKIKNDILFGLNIMRVIFLK